MSGEGGRLLMILAREYSNSELIYDHIIQKDANYLTVIRYLRTM
jgi:hypothetical protein